MNSVRVNSDWLFLLGTVINFLEYLVFTQVERHMLRLHMSPWIVATVVLGGYVLLAVFRGRVEKGRFPNLSAIIWTFTLLFPASVLFSSLAPGTASRIAFTSRRDGIAEIYVMNRDGSRQINLTNSPSGDYWPQWSPSGSKIIFHSYPPGEDVTGEGSKIYVIDINGKNSRTQLTHGTASDKFPGWSPNGKLIVFSSNRDGNYNVYVMKSDGKEVRRLTNNPARDYYPMWSPDGKRILFDSDRDENSEIYVMDANGGNPVNLTMNPARDTLGAWSPDGTKIAFSSDRSGQMEVWVMNSDGSNVTRLTTEGGEEPRWSPDGTQIAFVSDRNGNMDVYIMNSVGTGEIRLTYSAARDWNPSWSP